MKKDYSFIGMCSNYWHFIPKFSMIADPLIDLISRNARKFPDLLQYLCAFTSIQINHIISIQNLQIQLLPWRVSRERDKKKHIYFLSNHLSDTQPRCSTIGREEFFYASQKLEIKFIILYGRTTRLLSKLLITNIRRFRFRHLDLKSMIVS